MKLTPAQVAMRLLLGRSDRPIRNHDLKANIRKGRAWLVRIAHGKDFGYDPPAWHEYLWATDAGGYKWSRRSAEKWASAVRLGMTRPGWAEAVRELEAEET